MIWGSLGNSEEDLLHHASHCIPLGRGGTRLRGGGLKAVAQLETQLSVHLPQLSPAQRGGLACWVVGTVLAGSACLHAVFSMLATEVTDHGRWRQLLRMWMRDQPTAQGWYRGPAVEVRSCFAPLLRWILSLWQGTELVLALDPTSHRDRVVALAVSVVYRGCALPVAWQVVPAQRSSGSWVQAYSDLLPLLAAAIPPEMQVTVLCDRGIASPRLWEAICRLHWHPYMRYQQHITFQSPVAVAAAPWWPCGPKRCRNPGSCSRISRRPRSHWKSMGCGSGLSRASASSSGKAGTGTAPAASIRPASTATGWSWPSPRCRCWPMARGWRMPPCWVAIPGI